MLDGVDQNTDNAMSMKIFVKFWDYLNKLSGIAFVIRNNRLYTPSGKLIEEYDGNDPKHFPEREPYIGAQEKGGKK